MSTAQDPFRYLEDIPISKVQWYIPTPLKHPDDPNKILITTDYDEGDAGIFELDLISNESKHLHQYDHPYEFQPEGHGHFIHPPSKTLFIFGGTQDCFGAFNLETKEMKYDIDQSHSLNICDTEPKTCFIESRNELHVIKNMDSKLHTILNWKDNELQRISEKQVNDHFVSSELFYIPSQQKLITMAGNAKNEIWEYNLDKISAESQWKINHKMQIQSGYWRRSIILGFEHIMVIFNFRGNMDIWCHHLLNSKSYKSLYKVPELKNNETWKYVVKDGNNHAHILQFSGGKHVKVDLHALLPKELLKSHRDYYHPLIMGYLRKEENDNDILCIPFVLKTIVLKFFAL